MTDTQSHTSADTSSRDNVLSDLPPESFSSTDYINASKSVNPLFAHASLDTNTLPESMETGDEGGSDSPTTPKKDEQMSWRRSGGRKELPGRIWDAPETRETRRPVLVFKSTNGPSGDSWRDRRPPDPSTRDGPGDDASTGHGGMNRVGTAGLRAPGRRVDLPWRVRETDVVGERPGGRTYGQTKIPRREQHRGGISRGLTRHDEGSQSRDVKVATLSNQRSVEQGDSSGPPHRPARLASGISTIFGQDKEVSATLSEVMTRNTEYPPLPSDWYGDERFAPDSNAELRNHGVYVPDPDFPKFRNLVIGLARSKREDILALANHYLREIEIPVPGYLILNKSEWIDMFDARESSRLDRQRLVWTLAATLLRWCASDSMGFPDHKETQVRDVNDKDTVSDGISDGSVEKKCADVTGSTDTASTSLHPGSHKKWTKLLLDHRITPSSRYEKVDARQVMLPKDRPAFSPQIQLVFDNLFQRYFRNHDSDPNLQWSWSRIRIMAAKPMVHFLSDLNEDQVTLEDNVHHTMMTLITYAEELPFRMGYFEAVLSLVRTHVLWYHSWVLRESTSTSGSGVRGTIPSIASVVTDGNCFDMVGSESQTHSHISEEQNDLEESGGSSETVENAGNEITAEVGQSGRWRNRANTIPRKVAETQRDLTPKRPHKDETAMQMITGGIPPTARAITGRIQGYVDEKIRIIAALNKRDLGPAYLQTWAILRLMSQDDLWKVASRAAHQPWLYKACHFSNDEDRLKLTFSRADLIVIGRMMAYGDEYKYQFALTSALHKLIFLNMHMETVTAPGTRTIQPARNDRRRYAIDVAASASRRRGRRKKA